MPNRSRDRLFWGLLLVGLGLLFMFGNLGVLAGSVFAYWPVLVLIAGLWLLVRGLRRGDGALLGGTLLLGLGTFWLLLNLHVIGDNLFLPILLIALGLGLLLRSFRRLRPEA